MTVSGEVALQCLCAISGSLGQRLFKVILVQVERIGIVGEQQAKIECASMTELAVELFCLCGRFRVAYYGVGFSTTTGNFGRGCHCVFAVSDIVAEMCCGWPSYQLSSKIKFWR